MSSSAVTGLSRLTGLNLRQPAHADPTRVRGIDCRFTAPAYPGETIRTQMWLDGPTLRFRAFVEDRMVGDNGWAIFFEQSGANCG